MKRDSFTLSVPIKQYCRGAVREVIEEILTEYRLSLYVEGHPLIHIFCMPSYLEELVVGYLFAEGIIASYEDIDSWHVDEEKGRADVWLKPEASAEITNSGFAQGKEITKTRAKTTETAKDQKTNWLAYPETVMATDSGDVVTTVRVSGRIPLRPIPGATSQAGKGYDYEIILQNANRLLAQSELFRMTGNVHSVMMCRGGEMLCFMEDVGRFSAFDKCVGRAVLQGWDCQDLCVYTTGRLPSTLVLKAVRAGIPMLVSRSAPTDTALELAKRYGVALVGFARGDRMNIYS